jgi:tripartite-type tricarboxylate transporter receptor subunit TctC
MRASPRGAIRNQVSVISTPVIDLAGRSPRSLAVFGDGSNHFVRQVDGHDPLRLARQLLQIRGNFKLQMVPYTGGSAQALADVTAGRVTLVIEGYAGLAGAYESGQLKALAVASEKRLPHLPDLPTVAETLPGFVAAGWQCVVAPVGTPDAIVRKISDDLRAVLIRPEIKDKLAARGAYVHPATPTEAQAFVRSQQELWKPALEQVALHFKEK